MSRPDRVAVVGAGPAGLIAAETLASDGVDVTVYEHKRSVGRKFLLAGRGGLNITHSEPLDELKARYRDAAVALDAAIDAFSPQDLRSWCEGLGQTTFVGTSGRVFPESFRATPLLRAWLVRLQSQGVKIETGQRWTGWSSVGALTFIADGAEYEVAPDAVIFALGGASWPRVGSDGTWAPVFQSAGTEVSPLTAANCGVQIVWSKVISERFAGTPLKNTVFTVGERSVRGDAVLTTTGLEGGPVYALGPDLRRALDGTDEATLILDTKPDMTVDQLTKRLAKRRPKASVSSWLKSAGLPAIVVALLRETTGNQLPNESEPMADLTKSLPLLVTGTAPIDRAISTAGGIGLNEIDSDFMLVNRPGSFVAGEMLDWEAPTGGYLLQACFSTGVAAAHGALRWLQTQ